MLTCFQTARCLCLRRAFWKVWLRHQACPAKVSMSPLDLHPPSTSRVAHVNRSWRVVLRVTCTLRFERSWPYCHACRASIIRALHSGACGIKTYCGISRGNEVVLCEHVTTISVHSQGRAGQGNLTKWLGIQASMITLMRQVVESGTDTASDAEKDVTQAFKVVCRVRRGSTCTLHSGSATQAAELMSHQTFVLANNVTPKWFAASCYTWVLHTPWRASWSIW